ncbi:hypothetical protein [Sphingomonas sp.]|uniref:hypothetical protein n=1 Tax=Sphingomonas sp. TaxID=28214 RepID=UPI001B11C13E|nr:hypothetical protein [Sphingomonas sp.]MBO9713808.1 hypothetical protein [Sphingomonas sp.]
MPSEHPYHRSLSPLMWVFVVLASIELVVVHLLAGLLMGWWVAAALSLLSVLTITWIVALIRSFAHMPVLVGEQAVLMRAGRLKSISVPFDRIAGIRREWESGTLKDRSVLNLALIAHPNVLIDLTEPIGKGRRRIRAVAHCLDVPDAFVAAVSARTGTGARDG